MTVEIWFWGLLLHRYAGGGCAPFYRCRCGYDQHKMLWRKVLISFWGERAYIHRIAVVNMIPCSYLPCQNRFGGLGCLDISLLMPGNEGPGA